MPGAAYALSIDSDAWEEALEVLSKMEEGLRLDFARFVGEELLNVSHEAFEKQADPATGVSWAAWSKAYAASNKHGSRLLWRRGDLWRSITYEAEPERIIIGSNMVYAPIHQFGAKKGEFGTTKHGRPIPFGDIPARPFLGINDNFEDRILGDPAILELLEMVA
jgi:phage virion morphogenesis protein